MSLILISNSIGCGGKIIQKFFRHNPIIPTYNQEFVYDPPCVCHFYHVETIHTQKLLNIRTRTLLIYPFREFFLYYSFLRNRYKGNIDPFIYLANLLTAQKNLEKILKNKNINFLPINIFTNQKNLLESLQKISKKYLNCDLVAPQINFIAKLKLDTYDFKSNPVHSEELVVCKDYEEAYEFYHELYLESLYGI